MDLPAEAVLAYATIREALPHVIKFIPKVRDFVASRTAAETAKVVSDAQAVQLRAQADATLSAAWAAFATEIRADRERERQEYAKERERERQEHAKARERERQEHTKERERERREMALRLVRVEKAEAECQERAERIEREAKLRNDALRTELLEAVRRVQGRATPANGNSVIVEPIDPSAAVTPPLGHRLIPEPIPRLPSQDPENTDSLPPSPGSPDAV